MSNDIWVPNSLSSKAQAISRALPLDQCQVIYCIVLLINFLSVYSHVFSFAYIASYPMTCYCFPAMVVYRVKSFVVGIYKHKQQLKLITYADRDFISGNGSNSHDSCRSYSENYHAIIAGDKCNEPVKHKLYGQYWVNSGCEAFSLGFTESLVLCPVFVSISKYFIETHLLSACHGSNDQWMFRVSFRGIYCYFYVFLITRISNSIPIQRWFWFFLL